ncbi:MAG: prolipoprotein diacylglyceryl transferase [Elusimicrobiota bacterium]|nr:prolipoprotein diacylglyceryl transferase [Elusimicrobiota bacterium]
MLPVLLTIGPLEISTYGVLVALGWYAGVRWLVSRRGDMGVTENAIWDIVYWCFGGAFVGGKIMYFLVTPGAFTFTWEALRYGFVFYGGLIGGLAAGLWHAYRAKLPFLRLADWCMAALALGHGIGRLGCLAAGCCYGRHTDLPWGLAMAGDPSRHPTQVYEAALNLVLFGVLVRFVLPRIADKRWREGAGLASYVLGYAALRFAVEFLRGDDRGAFVLGLSPSQWVALAAAAATLAVLAFRRKSK